jgi:hypothetical protein
MTTNEKIAVTMITVLVFVNYSPLKQGACP